MANKKKSVNNNVKSNIKNQFSKNPQNSKYSKIRTTKEKLQKAQPFEKLMEPPKTKFGLRNVLQAIVGATILAIPIGFTEETWKLGESLPIWNIIIIFLLSIFFITLFAYRHFKKNTPKFYWYDLVKRVMVVYLASFLVVALVLFIIQKAPWNLDILLSFKRTVIVAFPSSLGATIAGSLK